MILYKLGGSVTVVKLSTTNPHKKSVTNTARSLTLALQDTIDVAVVEKITRNGGGQRRLRAATCIAYNST